jgi:hypothetical protein
MFAVAKGNERMASVGMEHAKEGLEHAHHALHQPHDGGEQHGHAHAHEIVHGKMHNPERHPRQMAVLIAVLAACLALAELGAKTSSTAYLTQHISLTDTYAFLQAKNIRASVWLSTADAIDSTPGIDDAARARSAKMRSEASRLLDDPSSGEGRSQLLERARHETELRDHADHQAHEYEYASGILQIAIVLASVSVVTRSRFLSYAAGVLGGLASLFALAVGVGLV